ncbi:unnamed protein product [Rotaria socialis]|uniref:Transcription factor TFIIIC triple barrel domain-containing protein n=1 Tax=Rotaria socialis TaxID=392032 RepID=A0A817ZZL1_9BILA|nr:unnamed protein product [Rotaria socialis]CAF3399809.1 unnamed protein product [Rotaria socialis]CAF3419652.1 unnamed protein product [Rotaria socialis]CAF3594259.1 unnamed protein product [Rotaria socialis]CAF3628959.1 unnamed protein product [Rotaria socialis]
MEVDTPSDIKNQPTNDADQADEDEEEDFLIMADIGHDIDQQTVLEHAVKSEIRAIDIDGTNPFIQIGPYTFQGQYNYILGTNLFFSTSSATIDDNASTSSRVEEVTTNIPNASDLNLIGMADKKLNLSRVYVYPKKADDTDIQSKS